jgi:hypothetical protein
LLLLELLVLGACKWRSRLLLLLLPQLPKLPRRISQLLL